MKPKILLTILIVSSIISPVKAWVEPTGTENIVAPLNTSSTAQTKAGDLGTNGNLCIKGDCKSAWPTSSSDTLQTVTERGSSTDRNVDFFGNLTVGSPIWSHIQFYSAINDTYNPISGASDRAHFHFGFPNTPVGKEPLIETPSDVWIIGGNHNLKVDGATSTNSLCLAGDCVNQWCPTGYFRQWRYEGAKAYYICTQSNAERACNTHCYPESIDEYGHVNPAYCYSMDWPSVYYAAKYINGEKYTRAYGAFSYWGSACDSGYVKGTHAECTFWRWSTGYNFRADWSSPDPGVLNGSYWQIYSWGSRYQQSYCNVSF